MDRHTLSFLDHMSHIRWRETVAHHLTDHRRHSRLSCAS